MFRDIDAGDEARQRRDRSPVRRWALRIGAAVSVVVLLLAGAGFVVYRQFEEI